MRTMEGGKDWKIIREHKGLPAEGRTVHAVVSEGDMLVSTALFDMLEKESAFPHCDRCGSSAWFCTVCHPSLIGNIRTHLATLSGGERIKFLQDCMEGYCRSCGTEHLPCYCERDE